ncbi:MAG: ROK family protein [Lacunisphaera sp.]
MKILVIDVGGTHVKVRATGHQKRIEIPSGRKMTARKMIAAVQKIINGWRYDAITIGYPGAVVHGRIASEPHNLRPGWLRFNFAKALGCPVKIINDAAMQAMGSYQGKRMLFLGLGTGLGSAMIIDSVLAPLELAHLPYKKKRTYEDYVGLAGLKRLGKRKWRRHVNDVVKQLKAALEVDYVVIGGGDARLLKRLPRGARLADTANAFRGGCRLWAKSTNPRNGSKPPRRTD